MQDQNYSSANFLERTDRLAETLGVSMRALASVIGISQAMLFGCRAGKYEPSLKTWRKLEQAESRSTLKVEEERPAFKAHLEKIRETARKAQEKAGDDPAKAAKIFDEIMEKLDRMDAHLGRIADAVAPEGVPIQRKLAPPEQRKLRRVPGKDQADGRQAAG